MTAASGCSTPPIPIAPPAKQTKDITLHPAKQELRGGLIKNRDFNAQNLGGMDLQALNLSGTKFFIKLCRPFLNEYYICANRNCYKFLPDCPFGNGYLTPNKYCNCDKNPDSSSRGAAPSSHAAQKRTERQKRMREQQKMIPLGW